MMPKLGHFGKYTRNILEVSICAGKGWKRSAERPCKKKVKEERNIPHTIKRRKVILISHIFCTNWLSKHVAEGNVEGTRRRWRRRKHLLDDRKDKRAYCSSKLEALAPTLENSLWKRSWTWGGSVGTGRQLSALMG